jgi:hypothetical protein
MHYVVYDYTGVAHIFNVLYVTFQTYEPNVQVLWLALLLVLLDSESKPHTGYWISGDFFLRFLQADTSYWTMGTSAVFSGLII